MKNTAVMRILDVEVNVTGAPDGVHPALIMGDDGITVLDTAYPGQFAHLLKENDKPAYDALLSCGETYTGAWAEPSLTEAIKEISDSPAR